MAVNIAGVETVFNSLISNAKSILQTELDMSRINSEDYAKALEATLNTCIEISVGAVQKQEVDESQISLTNAQISLTNAQISSENQRVISMQKEDTVREEQSAKDLSTKDAQIYLIDAQKITEDKKALLTTRQTTAYDDNLRVEEGKMLTQVVGMYGAGGTALPDGLETQMINAVDAITP